MYIVFDTETSNGLVNWRGSLEEQSVHLVQLAYKVFTDSGRVVRASSSLVRQTLPICEASKAIHGITDYDCKTYGRPLDNVFDEFNYWFNKSDLAIGYNVKFDMKIMEIAAYRSGKQFNVKKTILDVIDPATEFCKLPLTEKQVKFGITGFCKPKLSIAYQQIIGREMKNAHDAMVDVDTTIEILQELTDMETLMKEMKQEISNDSY